MISRRKIISRSLDNLDAIGVGPEEEEDIWYDKEKLFRDHINEVLAKWEQIDDEIWAKIIVFEKNRRVAKAYARSSVISINGSKNGFDGVRIGLNGFDNPMRDAETKTAKRAIGEGFKIKMDDIGNILIKRYGKSGVFVQNTSLANEETVIGADVLQMPNMALSIGTSAKLFDIRKYTTNINREFARSYPESKRLERQCLSAISIVKSDNNLINNPLWILVINVVAVDMLKNRLQTLSKSPSMDAVTNGTRLTMSTSLEDPYSTIESQVGLIYPTPAGSDDSNNSNSSSKSRRSILNGGFGYLDESPYMPKPDYEIYNSSHMPMLPEKKSSKTQQRKKQDDPYYCGLLARIPNFIKSSKPSKPKKESKMARKISASQYLSANHNIQPAHPIPIATFHQYPFMPMYPQNHRLSQSQLSLWDSRSLISAHGKLSDYVSDASINSVLSNSEVVSSPMMTSDSPYSEETEIQKSPKANTVFCRVRRELKSPAANIKMRALKSIKTPSKHPHKHFEQRHLEQNKETKEHKGIEPVRSLNEEQQKNKSKNHGTNTTQTPSLEEVLKDIVVYVEVRTGVDNRSAGVKKVIAALGARVNDKLLRNTTHVIFKDGLLSTYKKAKSLNIPIVSILWIEACKNERRICDTADFPISNLDRYENPEIYGKMKRYRSMQPDSECNKRVRPKNAQKESTPKSTPTKVMVRPSKSNQQNITSYFRLSDSCPQKLDGKETTPRAHGGKAIIDSPATILLNRMSSHTYTPIANLNKKKPISNYGVVVQNSVDTPLTSSHSLIENNITDAANSIAQMSICQTPVTTLTQQKQPVRRRRTLAPIKTTEESKVQPPKEPCKQRSIVLMTEEIVIEEGGKSSNAFSIQNAVSRRTTFSYEPMDVTGANKTPTNDNISKKITVRRRTLFTPQKMLESPNNFKDTLLTDTTNDRRTLYTTQNMVESPNIAKENETNDKRNEMALTSIDSVDPCTPSISNSNEIKSQESRQYLSLTAPSSKSLNRRRTLFDISMDIISHQVQNLNSKSRISIAPQNNVEITPKSVNSSESNIKETTEVVCENNSEEPKINQITDIENSEVSTEVKGEKKKRKLFKPVDVSPFVPPLQSQSETKSIISNRKSVNGNVTTPKATLKRRRTLMPKQTTLEVLNSESDFSSETPPLSSNAPKNNSTVRTRRSTMDFEAIQHIRTEVSTRKLEQKNKQILEKENNPSLTNVNENAGGDKLLIKKHLPLLAFTNMHREQVEVINEAVTKLGGFKLDKNVTGATTHMVSLEARRTMNLLRGLVHGLWILDYKWIVDSLKSGYWLPEEPYEMKDFSRAVEICRAERQAFGTHYKCELFSDLGAFFISPRCDNIPIRELKELIRLCGGKVEENRQNAKFILSSCTKAFDDKIYVTPLWILDSITQMQLMRIQKYSAASQLPTTQSISNTRNMPTGIEFKDPHRLPPLQRYNYGNNRTKSLSKTAMMDTGVSAIYSRTCTS